MQTVVSVCTCQHSETFLSISPTGNGTDLLSQQAGNLAEVDCAPLGSTDCHQRHAVGRERLALATGDAALDHLTGKRVHHTCRASQGADINERGAALITTLQLSDT